MSFWQDQNEFIAIMKKDQNILKTALKKKNQKLYSSRFLYFESF